MQSILQLKLQVFSNAQIFLQLAFHLIVFFLLLDISQSFPHSFLNMSNTTGLISRLCDIQLLQTRDHCPTSYTLGIFSILCNQEMISPSVCFRNSHYKPHKHPTQLYAFKSPSQTMKQYSKPLYTVRDASDLLGVTIDNNLNSNSLI